MLRASDVLFDPESHRSTTPDGISVPHVTGILSSVGLSQNFEDIAQLSPRIADAILYRCRLGTAVHIDCHSFDDDDLDVASMHPEVAPYVLEAWATCRMNLGLRVPITRERRIFHPRYFYTGILDCIFLVTGRSREKRALIDLKIGDPDDAAAHLQTAAYEAAWLIEHPDEPIDERWAVQLLPGRTPPYKVTNYSARPNACLDFEIFKAAMTV